MNESIKTFLFIAAAAGLAITASVVEPESATPKLLSDQGQAFYPNFRDPQAVKTIEVIGYDESTATARPFQVEQRKGRWVLSSNNDYPVDIGDRLTKTAGALIDLKKDLVKSDSVQDHAKFGVVDPLDQKAAGLTGRGKRVTLRDAHKDVLADFILGKPVEGMPGYRYVRVPGEKRVYAVKTDADPSTKFSDWVNSGIARIPVSSVRKVSILSYQLDEAAGTVSNPEQVALTHDGDKWASPGGEALNLAPIQTMARTLDNLKIVDARPKPDALAQSLRSGQMEVTIESALSLRQKGFFVTQSGRLMASEGEMSVDTVNGVVYQLRFGEVAATAGETKPSGNRYLFVMAVFDPARAAKYGGDAKLGERQAKDLSARFADWYYVITNEEFQQLRLKKKMSSANAIQVEAILFDMDGTIVDSSIPVHRAWRAWGDSQGIDFARVLEVMPGRRAIETMQILAPDLPQPESAERFLAGELLEVDGIVEIPGAGAFIESLPADRWGVVTSAVQSMARQRIRAARLPDPRVLVSADMVAKGKPHPEGFLRAAELLGVEAGRCLVFEDAPAGIAAAKAAGMRVVGVETHYSALELGVERAIADFRLISNQSVSGRIEVAGLR